jgi:hypothetical protein
MDGAATPATARQKCKRCHGTGRDPKRHERGRPDYALACGRCGGGGEEAERRTVGDWIFDTVFALLILLGALSMLAGGLLDRVGW